MKKLEKVIIGLFLALAASLCLITLYYFVKGIVGFDN
jgi:hypothetical protein